MKIDLSKKITKYAKKILVIVLVIHICILSISNSYVNAATVLEQLEGVEVRTPTDEEVEKYINALIEYTSDWAVGMRPDWDRLLNDPDYDVNHI